MSRTRYIIAPKREFRHSAPPNWQDLFGRMDGIDVIGHQTARIQVEATPQAISRVRSTFGQEYNIEENIPHHPLRGF